MIKPLLFLTSILFITSCNNNTLNTVETKKNVTTEEAKSYFPVTAYLKGQLFDIKQKGLSPLKYTTVNGHTDSVMIKLDEIDGYAKEFLQPEIDSVNLIKWYTESKFLDQTINAFTFTYERNATANDTLQLLHWEVYVEPETGKVKRVYIEKKAAGNKTLQLTWVHNQWFKTVILASNTNGNTGVEKEEKILWDY